MTLIVWAVENFWPAALPSRTTSYSPARPGGTVRSKRTWPSRVLAAVSKATRTALRSAALTTLPPPTFAKPLRIARPSSFLKATTSARTLPLVRAVVAARRCCASRETLSLAPATVSSPSLSRMMLRSPSVPSADTASWTASYSAVSPRARSPLTTLWTLARSVVGLTSTPAVEAKLTTPTLTSFGTAARKSLTALRTVPMPASPIDPLVSMTSIVERLEVVAGASVTTADLPSTRAMTWVVSICLGSTPRMTSDPVTCPSALRRSLNVADASADADAAPPRSAVAASTTTPTVRVRTVRAAARVTGAPRT